MSKVEMECPNVMVAYLFVQILCEEVCWVFLTKDLEVFNSLAGRRLLYPKEAGIDVPGSPQAFPVYNPQGCTGVTPPLASDLVAEVIEHRDHSQCLR